MKAKKLLLFLSSPLYLISTYAVAHGYVEFPPARQLICHDDGGYWSPEGRDIPNKACKAAFDKSGTYPFVQINEYAQLVRDYLDISAVQKAVKDGLLCSAGSEQKAGMSIPSKDWQLTQIIPNAEGYITVSWNATAPHNPNFFEYWITREDHDFSKALKWKDLEKLEETGDIQVGPDRHYRMTVPMPQGRDDRAILFSRWQRVDPAGEGFYNCSDITFNAEGSSENTTSTKPVVEEAKAIFYSLGYYIPVGYPDPEIGDYMSFRGFRGNSGEVLEERLFIDATSLTTWQRDLADQINSKHGKEWQVGVKDAAGEFSFNNSNIHQNKVWSIYQDDSFSLSIIPKPEPEEGMDSTPEDTVDQGTWDPNTVYHKGDQVSFQEYNWVAAWWNKGTPPDADDRNNPWKSDTAPKSPMSNWESGKTYNEGNMVYHKGEKWEAQWWTQGKEPGTTGEWGVWRKAD